MKSWFATKKEANTEIRLRKAKTVLTDSDIRVFKMRNTKRKKPFFVGSYLDWLNI